MLHEFTLKGSLDIDKHISTYSQEDYLISSQFDDFLRFNCSVWIVHSGHCGYYKYFLALTLFWQKVPKSCSFATKNRSLCRVDFTKYFFGERELLVFPHSFDIKFVKAAVLLKSWFHEMFSLCLWGRISRFTTHCVIYVQ